MERAFPGLHLGWKVSEEGRPVALPRRDAWISEVTPDGGFRLVCNGDESYPVTISAWERRAGPEPHAQPLLQVSAELPLDAATIAVAVDMLEEVAEGARALWGHATPDRAVGEIAQQSIRPLQGPPRPPRGLPVLALSERLRAPEIPHCLGWLNYWSAATARWLNFPDPARDAELLSRSRRTATGGWLVRLTDEPLDLDTPVHLDALLRAYERFPEIGGRGTGASGV
ncbi:DUF5953 family protein [Hyalangium sp. s54d21]|uniref:DUF5953 family protein n=2 Tax=Hyalangium rubrum TaxID=3103134 RepID=A0ABU5HHJ4_9BACT|nr:DUF5953 family protein [Hyalangium sp. s54d21]MDY7232725.1 DUF5953 family protein [Hyalangium sp. s54d21]